MHRLLNIEQFSAIPSPVRAVTINPYNDSAIIMLLHSLLRHSVVKKFKPAG